jgi:hypothetical protein
MAIEHRYQCLRRNETVLEELYPRVMSGRVIMFDNYGKFPGATKAVNENFPIRSWKYGVYLSPKSHPMRLKIACDAGSIIRT